MIIDVLKFLGFKICLKGFILSKIFYIVFLNL